MANVYLLGGHQTDFATNWSKKGEGVFEIMRSTVEGALEHTQIDPKEVQTAHVSNFTGELFSKQAQLGGLFATLHPDFDGIPTARHEAACASGGVAVLAASAELECGRYDLACVVGVEQERNVPGALAADHLGVAAWVGQEAQEAKYPWPYLFGCLAEEYHQRYGLKHEHLMGIAQINFGNAKKNPFAQTRNWSFGPSSFTEDNEANPTVEGRIRRQDCSQLTDGGCAIFLASERYATDWAARHGTTLDQIPRLLGFGHRTATMRFTDKMERSKDQEFVFPQVRQTILDGFRRAGIKDVRELSGIETHDCFSITEYMAIDHFGLTPPGQSWRAIEEGTIAADGPLPVNASGGLMGGGHPVGATGVRMLLDAHRQVTGTAGDYQIPRAQKIGTLNLGGTATTAVSFVVGR